MYIYIYVYITEFNIKTERNYNKEKCPFCPILFSFMRHVSVIMGMRLLLGIYFCCHKTQRNSKISIKFSLNA